jgi:hypothetical protein
MYSITEYKLSSFLLWLEFKIMYSRGMRMGVVYVETKYLFFI